MSQLEQNIRDCLNFFGPCAISTIQKKLVLRGIELTQIDVLNTCNFMVRQDFIKEATGFNKFNKGFKV